MPKFPEPPPVAALAATAPQWHTLLAGTALWRVYVRGGLHPVAWNTLRRFGPTASRFDHHEPPPREQDRAILYAAQDGPTCVSEVFQSTRLIDRTAPDPWLVGFAVTRGLRLLDLTGTWPTRAGASMAINSGPRPRAQRWSRRIHAAYPDADGLLYPSSMRGGYHAVALYERAADALPDRPFFHRTLADPCLFHALRNAATDLGYTLV